MKKRNWVFVTLAAMVLCGLLAGCSATAQASATKGNAQIANPWKDATFAEAAKVLGGTMYNFSTLDKSYEQYALLVTTDDAVKNGLQPTAWVRYKKGDEDISLQLFKGGKLTDDLLKGKKTAVNGAPAYIANTTDGTSQIAWEANGLLMEIGTSTTWSDDALVKLAEGVSVLH